MSRRVLVAIFVSLTSACSSCMPPGAPVGARTGVTILVDFSSSFAPLNTQDRKALSILGDSAQRIAQRVEEPVKIQWLAITDESRRAPELCGGPRLFRQMLTTLRKPPADYFTNVADLRRWSTIVCPDAIVAMTRLGSTPFTDITGAVGLAKDSLSAIDGRRFMLVYSDVLEDQAQPGAQALPNLSDYSVLIAWRAGVDSLRDIDSRLENWARRFRESGARVCTQPAVSLTADDVVACLEKDSNAQRKQQ